MVKYDLCTQSQVRRKAGLNENTDLQSDDIDEYIEDASVYIYENYNPIYTSKCYIDEYATTLGSLTFKFTPDDYNQSVYTIGSLYIGSTTYNTGSFDLNSGDGTITFPSASFFTGKNGEDLVVQYVPRIYNKFATTLAAKYLNNDLLLMSPTDANTTRVDRLDMEIGSFEENLAFKGAFMSSTNVTSGQKRIYRINNPFQEPNRMR